MSYYVIKNYHAIPRFLFVALASWEIANGVMTALSIVLWWSIHARMPIGDWYKSLTGIPAFVVFLCVVYTAIGAVVLYAMMWVYWIAVERSSIAARIMWLLTLVIGLHFGAMLYAFIVWRRDMKKVNGVQPLRASSPIIP